jgi:hypothetical protein
MSLSTFYGFWDYWELYHKVTFDGINKLIKINEGITQIDVARDLYSDWKEWSQLEDNLKYEQAFSVVGGEDTVNGEKLDATFFLLNGWKIKPYAGSYDLVLDGNLFEVNGGSIKVPADVLDSKPNNITITTNTSVIVRQVNTAGGGSGGLTAGQSDTLFEIEDTVLEIKSTLQSPVEATLVGAQLTLLENILEAIESGSGALTLEQSTQLTELHTYIQGPLTASLEQSQATMLEDMSDKINLIYQLHGLDENAPLQVTQTERLFGEVSQSIETVGRGETQETTITRLQ